MSSNALPILFMVALNRHENVKTPFADEAVGSQLFTFHFFV